jgi:nitrate reductase cytochrome c-type subunit
MKKLLLLLILVLGISAGTQAQSINLKATKLTISDGTNVVTKDVDLNITIDLNSERCVIYSNKIQIIDFSVYRTYVDKDKYTVLECNATDSNYKTILFSILQHPTDNFIIIQITYSDVSYCYSCYIKP